MTQLSRSRKLPMTKNPKKNAIFAAELIQKEYES